MIAKSQSSFVFSLSLLFCLVGLVLYDNECLAEYRVFLLKISRTPATPLTAPGVDATLEKQPAPSAPPPPPKMILSTLDPNQYPLYYPLEKDESIVYVDTWKCPGRTGDFKPLCQRLSPPSPEPEPTLPP